jgi:hypothetical protein
MWDSLASAFSALFSTSSRKALLLGNFNCEQQFDALLIWPHGLAIFEFKADHGLLHAPENDSWYIEDRLVKSGGKLNPLGQVRRAKEALADRMAVRWHGKFHGVMPPKWMFAAGRVVFNAGTEWQDLLDHGTKKWFGIQTLDRVAPTFKELRIDTYNLTDQQVAFIGDAILGNSTRPPVPSEYKKHVKDAAAGVKLGALSLGGMVREFHDARSSMDKNIKGKIPAKVREFALADDDGFLLLLHDVLLENGERNITVGQNFTNEARMDRLMRGLRLGVQQNASGLCYARLWQARVNDDGTWSNRRAASLQELNDGARMNVAEKLRDLGASRVGSKGELMDDKTKSRDHLYVSFPAENTQVALAAYCLTTVLPLLNDYGLT